MLRNRAGFSLINLGAIYYFVGLHLIAPETGRLSLGNFMNLMGLFTASEPGRF